MEEIINFLIAFAVAFLVISKLLPRLYGVRKGEEIPLANKEIEEAKNKGDFFMIYFSTPSCGACKKMEPTINKLKKRYKVIKVDASKEKDVAKAYRVLGVPMLVLVKGGKVASSFVGIKSEKEILNKISFL